MNDNNDFSSPPSNMHSASGNNPNFQPQQPISPPSNMTPQNQGFAPMPPVGGNSTSGVSKGLIGIMIMLGVMILIVPMGLFKIGSPSACDAHRQKLGECTTVATPETCTPKRFSEESEYLTCKMVGAFSDGFKESKPSKYDSCVSLKNKIKVGENKEDFKCYAPLALLKLKSGKGKPGNPALMPPLEVQKMSVLNALSPSSLTSDFIFTLITIALLLAIMAFAAYTAHKKNKDSYMYVAGVYIIGIFAAYIYRYYVAGFYHSNVVVMLVALIGAIPMIAIIVGKTGRLGQSIGNINDPGNYTLKPAEPEEPLPTEPLTPTEMTKFEKMGLENTSIFQSVFVISFIVIVLTLIPIGLVSMGKTSKADSSMKKEAIKMTSLAKKQANETTEDIDMGDEEEPVEEGM